MGQKQLTKERIKRLFSDNFQLTNHAIEVAQQQISSGNEDLNVTELLEEIRLKKAEEIAAV